MASAALTDWNAARSNRLDELLAAHVRIGGTGVGRRTETEQINWALILRLAGEFQGFVRDLHAEGAAWFARHVADGNVALETTLATLITQSSKLDIGNATPGAIGDAFARFGVRWWPALEAHDERSKGRQGKLEKVNRARNAIAHGRLNELDDLRIEGTPLNLATIRRWRSALNGLADTMDIVLANHLAVFLGAGDPW